MNGRPDMKQGFHEPGFPDPAFVLYHTEYEAYEMLDDNLLEDMNLLCSF